jgi:hypothetical protein
MPRTSPPSARPSALQDKVDYWNPVFAGHDFAKESDKTHKPDVIFLIYNDHTTAFTLQGSRGLIKGGTTFSRPAN